MHATTAEGAFPETTMLTSARQAFENASTNVAAAQMRNALTTLAESVTEEETKKVKISKTYQIAVGS